MSIPARPPRPNLGSAPDEESRVLLRTPGDAPAQRPRQSSSPGELTPHERLERKLKLGQKLLNELPASNEHARLLSIAVMRRDEALLDGVLKALGREI
jgi:hypothetical protein